MSGADDPPTPPRSASFNALARRLEISAEQADDLHSSLCASKVVLLLDDSASMRTRVPDPMSSAYSCGGPATRWSELVMLAHECITLVASIIPAGLDCHFLSSRPAVLGLTSYDAVAPAFASGASECSGTPMITRLRELFELYSPLAAAGQRVLFVIVTDGAPSDGSPQDLFNLLRSGRHANMHVSLAVTTEDSYTESFLDGWDLKLVNFDTSDDYQFEKLRVLASGMLQKFSYTDYIIKLLLGSLMKRYFSQDQGGFGSGGDGCCCTA
jgi:hypothetical protein